MPEAIVCESKGGSERKRERERERERENREGEVPEGVHNDPKMRRDVKMSDVRECQNARTQLWLVALDSWAKTVRSIWSSGPLLVSITDRFVILWCSLYCFTAQPSY